MKPRETESYTGSMPPVEIIGRGVATEPGVVHSLRVRASETPGDPLLFVTGSSAISCRDLWCASEAVARVLEEAGIRRGGVVGLALPDGPEFIAGFFGIVRTAACAPLDPSLPLGELDVRLSELGVQALLVESMDSPVAVLARKRGIHVVDYRCGQPRGDGGPNGWQRHIKDDVVLLLQTSATTGQSKVVPISDANLQAMISNSARSLELTAQDRFLSLMPLFHSQGLLSCLIQIASGGTVVVTKGFDAKNFLLLDGRDPPDVVHRRTGFASQYYCFAEGAA